MCIGGCPKSRVVSAVLPSICVRSSMLPTDEPRTTVTRVQGSYLTGGGTRSRGRCALAQSSRKTRGRNRTRPLWRLR
ncbi:hypothetical protein PR002_g21829 [Phytophthora rubi]|uniref:Uncharacterized protein n=1 Tax=Phytophthora rubi TaxID=129364 RepID=A0A6A3J1L4_9STRA|nr:hypothetical protein PR002_g21829 [Phytophthora rubi]